MDLPICNWQGIGNLDTLGRHANLETKQGLKNSWFKLGKTCTFDFPNTMDCREYEAIAFDVFLPYDMNIEFEVDFLPLKIARPEFFPKTSAKASVCGEGWHHVEIAFSQFDFNQMVSAFLKYVSSIQLHCCSSDNTYNNAEELAIKNICLKKIGNFHMYSDLLSKAGIPLVPVNYNIVLDNETDDMMKVRLYQEKYGRETISLSYPEIVMLPPFSKKHIEIEAVIPQNIPAGGYEMSILRGVPNGDASKSQEIKLITSHKTTHPFLLHTDKGWQRVIDKIDSRDKDRKVFEEDYIKIAEEWEIPLPAQQVSYVYPAYSQNQLRNTVIAWKLTGNEEYAMKCVNYLKGLLDESKGYMTTEYSYFQFIESYDEYAKGDHKVRRACNAGWVQEAEFFIQITIAYDLLFHSGYLDDRVHKGMELMLRNYMDFAGWRLTDGDGNNFQLAEMTAGLFCAFVLQDYNWIIRFIQGKNGFIDLLSSVFYDDGVYFEGATSYMRLAADIFFEVVNGSQNFGINLKDMIVPASFDKNILHAPWAMREKWSDDGKPFLGMKFENKLPVLSPIRTLKQYFDALLLLLNDKGIMFSMNDSNEHYFFEVFDRAYYLYHDDRYAAVINKAPQRSLLFGLDELPGTDFALGKETHLLPSSGLGILREETTVNGVSSITQAVLKFAPHGGYHGHFDRLSLVSLIKDDHTFHNMEHTWFGYMSFLFKMWVQTSVAHNMVTVDLRMQEPTICEPVAYYSGEDFQAVGAQTTARWCDPPYGGQTPYPIKFPEEKCKKEGKYILPPKEPRKQGDIGEYSEQIFQRRLLILTDGYCIIWDFIKGEIEHDFDCLYHPVGCYELSEGELIEKTDRFSMDPYGAGQFVTNCSWYQVNGTAHLHFDNNKSKLPARGELASSDFCDIYRAYPQEGEVIVGKYPEPEYTFTDEDIKNNKEDMKTSMKKTVSFRVHGKEARYITLIETGKSKGQIDRVTALSYNKVKIEYKNGSIREFIVDGMDDPDKKNIEVRCLTP